MNRLFDFFRILPWIIACTTSALAYSINFTVSPAPGAEVARFDFEKGKLLDGLDAKGVAKDNIRPATATETVDGSRALVAECRGQPDNWNVFFKTRPGLLKTGGRYRVSVDYKFLEPWADGSYAYLFIRSGEPDARWRPAPTLEGKTGQPGRLVYEFLTADEPTCAISLGVRGRGAIAVDNILVEALPLLPAAVGEATLPASAWRDAIGVCAHFDWRYFYKTEDAIIRALDLLADLGIGWIRLSFTWDSLFPKSPDNVDAASLRRARFIVDEIEKRNMKLLVILVAAPAWASSSPDPKIAWRYAARDIADYERYVRYVATEFKGRVAAWEVGNETNWEHFWLSPFSEYLRELHAASRILRDIDPGSTILCAGLTDAGLHGLRSSYRGALADLLSPENASAYDAFSLHLYPGDPADTVYMVNSVAALMREKHALKPIWITETGYSVFEKRTLQDQADFMARLLPELMAHPQVARAFIYNTRVKDFEASAYERGFGLLDTDFTPRPQYERLRAVLRQPAPAKNPALQ